MFYRCHMLIVPLLFSLYFPSVMTNFITNGIEGSSLGIKTCISRPWTEGTLTVYPGDIVQVWRQKGRWLFGEKVSPFTSHERTVVMEFYYYYFICFFTGISIAILNLVPSHPFKVMSINIYLTSINIYLTSLYLFNLSFSDLNCLHHTFPLFDTSSKVLLEKDLIRTVFPLQRGWFPEDCSEKMETHLPYDYRGDGLFLEVNSIKVIKTEEAQTMVTEEVNSSKKDV